MSTPPPDPRWSPPGTPPTGPAPNPGWTPQNTDAYASSHPWNPAGSQTHPQGYPQHQQTWTPQGAQPTGQPGWNAMSQGAQQSWQQASEPANPFGYQGGQDGYVPQFGAPAPGVDPRAPIGGHVPAAVTIDQYQHRRSRRPILITAVVLALVALAVVLGTRAINRPATATTPTPTPSAASTATAIATGDQSSVQFDNQLDGSEGTWSITKSVREGTSLVLTMSVTVTGGTQPMSFFAVADDADATSYDPRATGAPSDLLGKSVAAGQTVTGTVTFDNVKSGDLTVFITDSTNRQVTAILVHA